MTVLGTVRSVSARAYDRGRSARAGPNWQTPPCRSHVPDETAILAVRFGFRFHRRAEGEAPGFEMIEKDFFSMGVGGEDG